MKNKQLKKITEEELKEKIKNHELWLRGEENLDNDFSGLYIGNWTEVKGNKKIFHEINSSLFDGEDLSKANFSGSDIKIDLYGVNLTEANFQNCNLEKIKFYTLVNNGVDFLNYKTTKFSNLLNSDFRGAIYNSKNLSEKQKKEIILTDKEYNIYMENKKLKYDNQEKEEKLVSVSDNQINKIVESFENLEKKFRNEEYFWLLIIFLTFIGLGINIFFYIISNNDYFKFLPSIILLFTFLYFINSQFKTAKKLRIENQNKVALLHGMIGIKADTDKDMDKNIFYQNVANIVFSKVYEGKEENLPLDKVLELVKIINSNNKK